MAINFSNTTPAAPTGGQNVLWQTDGAGNYSAYALNIGTVAQSNLTAQSAAISATTLYAIGASGGGLYRVSWVATVTTVDTTAFVLGGTTGFQLKYTDLNDSVVKTSNPTTVTVSSINNTGTSISGTFNAYCKASTNLQYLFGVTLGTGDGRYDLSIRAEYLA